MTYQRNVLDTYLSNLKLTRNKVATLSNTNANILQRSSTKDVLSMNKKTFYAIAMATGKKLADVYGEMSDLEMATDITPEELSVFMNYVFKNNVVEAYFSTVDMGYPIEAVVMEITLPSMETIRFGVHFIDKTDYDEDSILSPVYPDGSFVLTKDDILQELANSMRGYDHFNEDYGLYYPAELASTVGTNHTYKTDYEIIGICKKDSEFLADLGKKLLSYRG